MLKKDCQIVLIGHHPEKLVFSIDKEIFSKLIFITERSELPGTQKATETLQYLMQEYRKRNMEIENKTFDFHIETKSIAELTHLIYQLKLLGYEKIIVNVSGGLRYMDIWLYLACSITNTRIVHGDFIYKDEQEVGIYKNNDLKTIYLGKLTSKQFEFLKLFFNPYSSYLEFFIENLSFNENPLLNNVKVYDSIEEIRIALNKSRGKEELTRGSINGFIRKLDRISALQTLSESKNKNKKKITISNVGIAFFLQKLYENNERIIKTNNS